MTFDKVEPIPVVGVAPDSDPLTYLGVNTQWVEILVGLVEKAMWLGFWDGTDEQKKQAVSHVSQLAGLMVGGLSMAGQVCTVYESSSSSGGSSSVGWQTRQLTGMDGSPSWLSLDTGYNRFTPVAGRYLIHASAPFFRVGTTTLRLAKSGTPSVALEGLVAQSSVNYGDNVHAPLRGLFTANGSDYYYFSHYFNIARSNDGLGRAPTGGVTSYHTFATIWRLGD